MNGPEENFEKHFFKKSMSRECKRSSSAETITHENIPIYIVIPIMTWKPIIEIIENRRSQRTYIGVRRSIGIHNSSFRVTSVSISESHIGIKENSLTKFPRGVRKTSS